MNLIYQYWAGGVPAMAQASSNLISKYAKRIGAEYLFDKTPRVNWDCPSLIGAKTYFPALSPVFDEAFDKYDTIVFMDADIFPMHNNIESIFELDVEHVGVSEEKEIMEWKHTLAKNWHKRSDFKWTACVEDAYNISLPKSPEGWPRIFNSGVVVWTKEGRLLARKLFDKPSVYQQKVASQSDWYKYDQNYLIAMIHAYPEFKPTYLPDGWNCIVGHGLDTRTPNTKLIHKQGRGKYNLTSIEECMELIYGKKD